MKLLYALPVVIALAACDRVPNSTQIESRAQEQQSMQAVQSVGMPGIDKFAEKRMAKTILELRDKMIPTFTYTQDMNGHFHYLCNSVGYGLPYATQYTNPQHVTDSNGHYGIILPQADPNGLYSPASADGTWVMCLNPATKEPTAVYIEPRVVVSPFALPTTN